MFSWNLLESCLYPWHLPGSYTRGGLCGSVPISAVTSRWPPGLQLLRVTPGTEQTPSVQLRPSCPDTLSGFSLPSRTFSASSQTRFYPNTWFLFQKVALILRVSLCVVSGFYVCSSSQIALKAQTQDTLGRALLSPSSGGGSLLASPSAVGSPPGPSRAMNGLFRAMRAQAQLPEALEFPTSSILWQGGLLVLPFGEGVR